MAGSKAVTNAGEAAGRKLDNAARAGGNATPRNAQDVAEYWRQRADELRVAAPAAREFDQVLVPEIQAAGYPNSVIKDILRAEDPHLAAKQFLADERAALTEALTKANWGYTPEQMAGMNLRDLKETVADASKGGDRPSGIRGKAAEASTEVESRLPPETTAATPAPKMDEPPAADGEQKADAVRNRGRAFYSDGIRTDGPGFFTEKMAPAPVTFESMIAPGSGIQRPTVVDLAPAAPPTPSMQELIQYIDGPADGGKSSKKAAKKAEAKAKAREQLVSDPSRVQLQTADPGDAQPVMGDEFYVSANMPAGARRMNIVEQRGGAAENLPAAGGGQPAPNPEVEPARVAPKGPSLAETDPLTYRGKQAIGAAGWVAKNAWPTALATVATGAAVARGLGWGSGSNQPAPSQPGQSAGTRPQITVLPREALRQLEQRPRSVPMQQPMMAPPMMAPPSMPVPMQQPPMQAPAQPPQGRPQTTDIIRQLSGRMA